MSRVSESSRTQAGNLLVFVLVPLIGSTVVVTLPYNGGTSAEVIKDTLVASFVPCI